MRNFNDGPKGSCPFCSAEPFQTDYFLFIHIREKPYCKFRLGISHFRISAALLYFSLKCSYLLISAEAGSSCDDQASTTTTITTPAAAPAKEKKHRSRRVAVMSTGGGKQRRPRKRGKSLSVSVFMSPCKSRRLNMSISMRKYMRLGM